MSLQWHILMTRDCKADESTVFRACALRCVSKSFQSTDIGHPKLAKLEESESTDSALRLSFFVAYTQQLFITLWVTARKKFWYNYSEGVVINKILKFISSRCSSSKKNKMFLSFGKTWDGPGCIWMSLKMLNLWNGSVNLHQTGFQLLL